MADSYVGDFVINVNQDKIWDTETAMRNYNELTKDRPRTRVAYGFDNQTNDFFDQLFLVTDARNIFEIGMGHGTFAYHYLWQSHNINYKAIDNDPKWTENAELLEGWFGDRFSFDVVDSQTYNMQEDPNRDTYDMLICNGSYPDTNELTNDIQLGVVAGVDWIFVDNLNRQTIRRALTWCEDENPQFPYELETTCMYKKEGFTGDGKFRTHRIVGALYRRV